MNRARVKLVLLGAVFAAPVAFSYIAYVFWRPEKLGNYGELLNPPALVAKASVRDLGGKVFPLKTLGGKWLLIQSDSGACELACQTKLNRMRQAHLALGKNQDRVRRVSFMDDGLPGDRVLQSGPDGLLWLDATGSTMLKLLPAAGSPRDHIYVIDPLGNLFMRYSKDVDVKGIVKDMERLLKASQIG
jgi:hypothetical protein